ncbi:hypothetical protein HY634_02060 [Candidatus Uhrbacteria bacterium]|nr:hypothetical protein [Candidatus Uhrbacteria bacterium]
MRKAFRQLIVAVVLATTLAMPLVAFAACPAGQQAIGTNADGTDICGPASGGTSGTRSGAACDPSVELCNPLPVSDIPSIIGNVLRAGFGILGSIALLMFIYGGFVWLTSGGNPEKITTGKNTMVWAVLGIAIIFASYAIVTFVIDALAKQA